MFQPDIYTTFKNYVQYFLSVFEKKNSQLLVNYFEQRNMIIWYLNELSLLGIHI